MLKGRKTIFQLNSNNKKNLMNKQIKKENQQNNNYRRSYSKCKNLNNSLLSVSSHHDNEFFHSKLMEKYGHLYSIKDILLSEEIPEDDLAESIYQDDESKDNLALSMTNFETSPNSDKKSKNSPKEKSTSYITLDKKILDVEIDLIKFKILLEFLKKKYPNLILYQKFISKTSQNLILFDLKKLTGFAFFVVKKPYNSDYLLKSLNVFSLESLKKNLSNLKKKQKNLITLFKETKDFGANDSVYLQMEYFICCEIKKNIGKETENHKIIYSVILAYFQRFFNSENFLCKLCFEIKKTHNCLSQCSNKIEFPFYKFQGEFVHFQCLHPFDCTFSCH